MEFIRRCSGFLFGMECLGCGSVSERLDPWLCPACREELLREIDRQKAIYLLAANGDKRDSN